MVSLKKLAAATVVAVSLGAASASADDLRIVVVSHGQASDPFWSVVKNGVVQGAKDMGVSVDYRAPETFDMVAMSQLIDAAVASKPDGLIVSIPDADALGKSIKAAVAAKIPVISMNSGSDVSRSLGCLMHIGQEEEYAGKKAGERMKAERSRTRALSTKKSVTLLWICGRRGFPKAWAGPSRP